MAHARRLSLAPVLLALCACGPGAFDARPVSDASALDSDAGRDAAIDGGASLPPTDAGIDAVAGDDAGERAPDAGGTNGLDGGGDPPAPPLDGGDDAEPAPADAGASLEDAGVVDDDLIDVIDHAFLIAHFGGNVVDALDYSDDLAGFQLYLDDVGIQFFSANEITTPNNPGAAQQCGYDALLPARGAWEKVGALALLSDQLRSLVGEPVFMRNWWRPPCYNALVGGAAGGDHPDADAVDLDFLSADARAAAQAYLCETYWAQDIVPPEAIAPGSDVDPRLNLSVGLGGATLHVGLLSDGGRRFWFYGSYTEVAGAGDCW
jgi:hypothetical protein